MDVDELIKLKDEYYKMLPISLTTLEAFNIEGTSLKEELAVFDKDNNNYTRAITVTKTNNTSSISYNINKEYKYLNTTVAISKEVSEKNKNYGRIKIIADDKTIYDSQNINKNFKTKELKLDISNINILKIVYNNSNNKVSSKDNVVIALLGNPTLLKY